MSEKFVKSIFWIVGMCLAAMLLYQLFFVGDNSAINQACRMIETPISKAYYDDVLYPSMASNKGVVESLGGSMTITTELQNDYILGGDYSTGWK